MEALVVVDVQNDFLPGGALAVPEGDQIIPLVNRLQDKFDLVVASKDWHPPDHASFAVMHNRQPGEVIMLDGLEQVLWPAHCVQGTPGAEFPPGLKTDRLEQVFFKGVDREIDSYSTFFDNGHKRSTGLGQYLKQRGVTRVYLVGLATDYCVNYSARDALQLGFETIIVEDACRGIDLKPGDVARVLSELQQLGAQVIHSNEILNKS